VVNPGANETYRIDSNGSGVGDGRFILNIASMVHENDDDDDDVNGVWVCGIARMKD